MARKKLAAVTAASFDAARTYQVDFTRPCTSPCGTLRFRPVHNPYTVTGSVAAAVAEFIKPDTVIEITD
ncbi:hypothetical protein PQJ75_00670 [Rhodoplanes sp. TEM]|uniref:Uncharacterized protein n=1 Tax=Rhodoplanes tepidamans TaxID=200616 RepID=A0ABT5J554_RHOTP|nr:MULTISPECIES: hypothetical protein [Rhodoplanes]MDC7784765.1 hypothetical protein [Rhodoplanes tepidamans]MDC7982232.1 hypothetical protein [Rhodoplanes sp. TEM]MDQ0356239.1 hypothetical protein [Rhodoplanes tepidamans]